MFTYSILRFAHAKLISLLLLFNFSDSICMNLLSMHCTSHIHVNFWSKFHLHCIVNRTKNKWPKYGRLLTKAVHHINKTIFVVHSFNSILLRNVVVCGKSFCSHWPFQCTQFALSVWTVEIFARWKQYGEERIVLRSQRIQMQIYSKYV